MFQKHYCSDAVVVNCKPKSHEEKLLYRAQNSTDNWLDSGGLFSERNSGAVCKDHHLKPNYIANYKQTIAIIMLRVVFVRFSGHAAYGNAVKLSTEKGKQFVQGKDYHLYYL